MRVKRVLAVLVYAGLIVEPAIVPAKAGDDLILPPDFRASAPAADPEPQKGPSPKKEAHPKTDAKAKAPATAAERSDSETKVEKPAAKAKDDDALSVGLKWNGSNQTVNGGPGSLSEELNKNINGATVGTGAQVGFKYKF